MSMDIDSTIRTVFNDGLAGHLDYYTEYLDVARFPEPDYEPAVRDFFRRKYASRNFDVVLATTNAMVDFVNKYRDELFPGAAVVYSAGSPRPGPKTTGVLVPMDLKSTIDIAMQLHPDLRHVFVVSGVSEADRFYQELARVQFRGFDGRLDFMYSTGLAMPDLLRRVAELPRHTIVYFLSFFEDSQRSKFDELKALDLVAAAANVPTYVWIDTREGHGSLGGNVMSVEVAAAALASVALRVLKGESPESIPVREIDATITQFDWRQLRRWGISETGLPAGSLVRFRQPSMWAQYKFHVVGAASLLVLQTALIAGLLVQRARRRRVENALRASNEQNQDLAGRLISAQETERARIARDLHDDVSQQLAGFSIMLGALKGRLSPSGPERDLEETLTAVEQRAAALADAIRTLSHELHSDVLQFAGLVTALEDHCVEFGRQRDIDVTFSADDNIDPVDPGVALCLYRVVQEALTNIARHGRARAAEVRLARTAVDLALDVVDDGVGFDSDGSSRRGLGLRSMSERVRLVGGRLRIESQPGRGTKLLVRIPIADVTSGNQVSRSESDVSASA